MISRERASRVGTAIGHITSGPQWVQCKDYVHVEIYQTGICEVDITRTSFSLEEEMAFSQAEATLAFTINTFGTSAVCVSCYRYAFEISVDVSCIIMWHGCDISMEVSVM